MTSTIPALKIRQRLGREDWRIPEEFGPDGWRLDRFDGTARIIVTAAPFDGPRLGTEGQTWIHASISHTDHMPTYEELTTLHAAIWPNGYAYQVFAPPTAHINIHPYALHLWGRDTGAAQLPDFGANGTI